MVFFHYLAIIAQQYVVPFFFAMGLIFFIYALIKYFILGPGEEPVREDGRIYFIKANVWFFAGLVVYLIVTLLISFFTWTASISVDSEREIKLQRVPDVPTSNE